MSKSLIMRFESVEFRGYGAAATLEVGRGEEGLSLETAGQTYKQLCEQFEREPHAGRPILIKQHAGIHPIALQALIGTLTVFSSLIAVYDADQGWFVVVYAEPQGDDGEYVVGDVIHNEEIMPD